VRGSFGGVLAIGAFTTLGAKLLRQIWKLLSEDAKEVNTMQSRGFSLDFSELPNTGVNRIGLTASICVAYLGLAAWANGNAAIAVLCTVASSFFLGWIGEYYGRVEGAFRIGIIPSSLMYAFFATAVTFIGLLPNVLPHLGLVPYQAARLKAQENSTSLDQLHSAVILLTERHTSIPLILPHPSTRQIATKRSLSRVASILFSGEYWFFRWPLRRPPASAFRERGDPTSIRVTSEDFGALVMQARQKIGRSVDMHCCRWLDVVVNDDDQEPETVGMELILINSSVPERNSQTLGVEALTSRLRAPAGSLSSETKSSSFRFAMASHPAIRSFDEIVVWFHLEAPRSRQSASVSVQRFDLIP
jgi:hypothetical protein